MSRLTQRSSVLVAQRRGLVGESLEEVRHQVGTDGDEGQLGLPGLRPTARFQAGKAGRSAFKGLTSPERTLIHIVGPYSIGPTFSIMSPLASKTDLLLRLARKGPVRARDLDEARIPRAYLKRLCDRGLLEHVDRGLYRLADAPATELHSLA